MKIRYTTRSMLRSCSGSSPAAGTWYGLCASAILRLARTIRLPIVDSATRNARAISPVVRPPSMRRVSATRAGRSSAGWQQVKISRSRSSSIALVSLIGGCSCRARRSCAAWRSGRAATDRSRRSRPIARRRAVTMIQAPGPAGTPSRRQVTTAASNASCTASSAIWRSPTYRTRVARTAACSSRNTRPNAGTAITTNRGPRDRPYLDRAVAGRRHPRRPVQRFVEVGAGQHVVTGEDLLGHRERAVGELGLAVAYADGRRALDRVQGTVRDEQPGLPETVGQLLPQRPLRPSVLLLPVGIEQHHVLRHSNLRGIRPGEAADRPDPRRTRRCSPLTRQTQRGPRFGRS